MTSSSYMRMEIELISGEGLKVDAKPVKRKTSCIVRIDEKSRVSKLDECGGSYPIWKDKLEMDLPLNGNVRFITTEVVYRTSRGTDKSVGYAKIPVSDFMGAFAPLGHLNFLSYRLRDQFGDKSGIINISIIVKPNSNDKFGSSFALAPVGYSGCSSSMAAYTGREVAGVPVWSASQRST